MKFEKGFIDIIGKYRDYRIVIEHNLNIFEKVGETDPPIHTICGMGRCVQGTLEEVHGFIDDMFVKYNKL